MKYYTYILFDKKTLEPFYVGKGNGKRIWHHFRGAFFTAKTHLHNTIAKMIRNDNCPGAVLKWCESEEEAYVWEMHLIHKYGRRDLNAGPLLNQTNGGDGGNGAVRKGRVLTEEHKRNIGKALRGRKMSDIFKKLTSARVQQEWDCGRKSRVLSAETKKKMSESRKGLQNTLGHKHSVESKKKISESMKKSRAQKFWSTEKRS